MIAATSVAAIAAAVNVSGAASAAAAAPVRAAVVTAAANSSITFRGVSSGSDQVRNGLKLPVPAGIQAGDVLLASIDVRGWSDVYTAPTGWTLLQDDLKSTAMRQATFVHVVGSAGEPASYNWTFTKGYEAVGVMLAYAGVDNANPVDVVGGLTSNAVLPITAPSVTTTAANDMVVGFFGTSIAASITPPVGTTNRGGASWTAGSQTQTIASADIPQQATAATGTLVATASQAASNVGHTVALRPSGTQPPPPPGPLANDDTYSATSGQALTVPAATGVLANDTSSTGTLTASLATTTTHGTLALTSAGSFSYTPTAGFAGSDAFTYTASDGTSTSAPATVKITVTAPNVNHPPVVTSPGPRSNSEGDAVSLQISASDPDVGDAITYTASGLPSGLSISSSGVISGVIAVGAAASSPNSVTITVTDKANATATANFTWTVTPAMTGTHTAALWRMDEPSGTTMFDSSGNGNDGSMTAVQFGVPGWQNSGYRFNGTNSIGIVNDSPSLNPAANDFSITAHVKFSSTPPIDFDIVRKGLGSSAGGDFKFELFATSSGVQGSCVARGSDSRAGVTAGPDLSDGAWHAVGCVKTAHTFSLVVDGVSYSQQRSIGSLSNSVDMTVGAQVGDDYFNGVLDEVTYSIG